MSFMDDGSEYDQETSLRKLADEATGLYYDSPEAKAIMDRDDWNDWWPIVDGDGILTGDIVGGDDDYFNVNDMAMVHRSDLTKKQIREANKNDGYIGLPEIQEDSK
jgi:hypothetical protein